MTKQEPEIRMATRIEDEQIRIVAEGAAEVDGGCGTCVANMTATLVRGIPQVDWVAEVSAIGRERKHYWADDLAEDVAYYVKRTKMEKADD